MTLGVLEDTKLEHVPGTSFVLEDASRPAEIGAIDSRIKYDESGPVKIILVPQPSDDPNDPLNWPLWRRDLILAILSFMSVLCATTSPLLAADSLTLSLYYTRNFAQIALLTGYQLMGVGVAGFLFVASARVWGKRHLFLLGNILMVISSIWGGASNHNYKSLLWARIFQGVALAPFEALVNACVGDLYFVHERGKRMAVSNVALFGSSFLTPILVGKISATIGWQWTFYLVAIFTGVCFPLVFFFVPETAYRRAADLDTDLLGEERHREKHAEGGFEKSNPANCASPEPVSLSGKNHDQDSVRRLNQPPQQELIPAKVSFAKSLMPFNGRKTDESFWKLVLRPFPLFFHFGILWACLIQGVMIGWTVLIGVALAALFLGPPLFFTQVQTGYMYTGAFVGAMLGLVFSWLLSDWSTKFMIKRNKGIYEPEFRILLVLPQLVIGCMGLYGYGITAADVSKYGYVVPDLFFGFVVFGMVMGAVASALYIVDAHRQIAVEAFTCLLIFKNLFAYVLTYFAYGWLVQTGVRKTFIIIASVQVAVCLLSIPMNSTFAGLNPPPDTYWGQFEEISKYNLHLSLPERMWAAWYAFMQNDVLATGIMSFVMHEVVYFGRSLPWIIIDRMPRFNKYKIQNQKIPTAAEQWNCAKLVLLSHFTVELPQIWLFHPMAQYFGLATGVPFPSILTMLYQIAIFFVMEDTWHYWTHRAMHWGPLYKNIHKIHHQYSAPFGLAAEYASPLEVMMLGLGTVGSPILFCAITGDLHILTMYLWIVCRLFQAIDAHSGYEFPWSLHHFLPFWAGADHHDVHHERFIGNYASSFRWWDFLLDTESGPEATKRRRERKLAKQAKKVE